MSKEKFLTSTDSVQAFYDAVVENFGKVDILANSAGIGLEQTICGHPDELWHQVIDINLNGAYRTIMAELAESSGQSLEDYISATTQSNPQKRMIQPQEIGALAAFLCRDEAFGITMQNLTVSAGSLW